jgi:glutamate--cysteine ligase
MPLFSERLDQIRAAKNLAGLADLTRGIEKESLRVTKQATLSKIAHPKGLGSALAHPQITTDYSEALLEFITPPNKSIDDMLSTLNDLHTFTYLHIGDESLWVNSMPCILNKDSDIPIGQYGSSNSGRMKSIYRLGLGHRYGRSMQTIAGIHFNFSVSDDLWEFLHKSDASNLSIIDYKTEGYLKLIRNFRRYFWLLLYLYGAAPAVCRSFIKSREHTLEPLNDNDANTLHKPYATSLRMGDLGYQSSAQESLTVTYNNIDGYIKTLCDAITQQHQDYSAIGIKDNKGEYQQLNDCLLQIENEFYSVIRPKRTAKSGQTALNALQNGGIEYIEVRCLDLNPFEDVGINKQQIQFLDIFLLFCLLEDSPPSDNDENKKILQNQKRMVYEGRKPNLMLHYFDTEKPAAEWSQEIMAKLLPIAQMIDTHNNSKDYQNALEIEQYKLENSAHTPSAKLIELLNRDKMSFYELTMKQSLINREHFTTQQLEPNKATYFTQMAVESLIKQKHIESDTNMCFEKFLDNYYKQYNCCIDG